MCKKSNELKRKQQIRTQMSQYVSNKDLLRVVWNVKRIHDKLLFDDVLLTWSNAYRQTLQKIY